MRIAVVSDIHGNLPALQAVVADAGAVDGWLNLGDILSGPLWPAETADWLMARPAWQTMAGNHERQLLTLPAARMGASDRFAAEAITPPQRAWLAALPAELRPLPGMRCVHGTPRSDLVYLLETVTPAGLRPATPDEVLARAGDVGAPLLLCGHSHLPRDVALPRLRIVNPGSVGLQAYDDDHPFEHVAENGTPHARYALLDGEDGAWRLTLRAVAYDWEAAASRAEANGRGDWADALRTGRVGRRAADVAA
ncbi:MAG: metallophosphoesterase family protein [Rubrivivax sp.]|nr:metallophosphoesterase family protein [Rubrivivax sp.]